jgi:hypothetical protein
MPPLPASPSNARVNAQKNTALMIAARDGDLAQVQQLLATPGHKAAKLELANTMGWRAIHYAAHAGNVAILDALVAAGANINVQTKNGTTPLGMAVFNNHLPIVQRLIQLGADVNLGGVKTNPIRMAFGLDPHIVIAGTDSSRLYPIATELIRAHAELMHPDNFHIGMYRIIHDLYTLPLVERIPCIEFLIALLDVYPQETIQYLNLNTRAWIGNNYYYLNDVIATRGTVELVQRALDVGLIPAHPLQQQQGLSLLDRARRNEYLPEINALINARFPLPPPPPPPPPPAEPSKPWKGWTRGDLGKFDIVFDAHNAINFSICPICFKLVERQDGCMYMYHNCLEEQRAKGGFVHKALYEKYKTPNQYNPHLDGMVWWCTVCGRICKSHVHYELLPPFIANPTTVQMDPGADPFGNDCRGANKGGGIPEKIARFRRAREYALELQGQVEQITEDEAMKQLVEEMWVAPIARYQRRVEKIMQEAKYNIPNVNFPPNVAPAAGNAPANNAPNIPQPQANRNNAALRPELVEGEGLEDELMLEEDIGRGVKFHHRRPDGTIYHHEKPLGRVGFEAWFSDDGMGMAKNFANQRFGKCYWPECNAIWYPQEIEPFVDTVAEERFLPREVFETYRQNFNKHMPARIAHEAAQQVAQQANLQAALQAAQGGGAARAQGGYRRIQKTRKLRKRKQHGGQPHDMFLELESGHCLLPRKNKVNKGGQRKTRRRMNRR